MFVKDSDTAAAVDRTVAITAARTAAAAEAAAAVARTGGATRKPRPPRTHRSRTRPAHLYLSDMTIVLDKTFADIRGNRDSYVPVFLEQRIFITL